MKARSNRQARTHTGVDVDARIGNAMIEVKFGVDAIRTLRTSLMQVAYADRHTY